MANEEIIDIVDENNNIIGSANVGIAHQKKLIHRVVGIFVFDSNGNLFLQKGNKYEKYDISVGGHVQKGETCKAAAKREMSEELGLNTGLEYVHTFLPKESKLTHYWSIFTAIAPLEWKFKETDEVKSLEKISMPTVISMVKSNPELFTYGFINTLKELVRIKKYEQ